ncbi:hypothetical protein SpCBS45565_g06854 [Spizellomyces sp. 'palustris']|nr:hypothetical protein SpCBS45565_g06854 [Spizellomyces sp. 'palustris']
MPRTKQHPNRPSGPGVVLRMSSGRYAGELAGNTNARAEQRQGVVVRLEGELSMLSEIRFAKLLASARSPKPQETTTAKSVTLSTPSSPGRFAVKHSHSRKRSPSVIARAAEGHQSSASGTESGDSAIPQTPVKKRRVNIGGMATIIMPTSQPSTPPSRIQRTPTTRSAVLSPPTSPLQYTENIALRPLSSSPMASASAARKGKGRASEC